MEIGPRKEVTVGLTWLILHPSIINKDRDCTISNPSGAPPQDSVTWY